MSYERKDIPALISLFKSVKKRVQASDGSGYFICHAIDKVNSFVASEARSLVRDALEGNFTLSGWITSTHGEEFAPIDNRESKHLRLRWCDKIIADLKEYAK
jgi:hypothetical protein